MTTSSVTWFVGRNRPFWFTNSTNSIAWVSVLRVTFASILFLLKVFAVQGS